MGHITQQAFNRLLERRKDQREVPESHQASLLKVLMVMDGETGSGSVVVAFRCRRASRRPLSRLISPKSLFDISKACFELQRRFTPPGFAPAPSSLRSWILHLAFLEKVFVKVIHVLNPLQLLLLAAGEEMENQPSIKVL